LSGFGACDGFEERIRQYEQAHGGRVAQAPFHGGAGGFGGDYRYDFAVAAQGFFEKVKGLSDAAAAAGQGSSRYGASDFFEERVGRAAERFCLEHACARRAALRRPV
jgi:hypothetical protein